MSDLIRRADAIEAICMNDCGGCRPNECGAYLDKSCDVVKALSALPPAEAEPTVIRSRTLMPTKDFKEWAKRIREVNPNAVVIPCDAEVVSAEAVHGWIPCSERLPDVDREVLASGYYNDVYIATLKEDKREEYYWSAFGGFPVMFSAVDAWMPLPTPYKGGEDE